MEDSWRNSLRHSIEEKYIQNSQSWFDVNRSPSGSLDIAIVSERFAGLPMQARREQIWDMLRQLQLPTATGFLSLYTLDEAKAIHLLRPPLRAGDAVYSWLSLAQQAANASIATRVVIREPRIPRTIAFYSF